MGTTARFEHIAEIALTARHLIRDAREGSTDHWSDGLCKLAASRLFVALTEAGYEAVLVGGSVRCDHPDPDAPEFIRAGGLRLATHYWVEVDDLVVDITADQFNRRLDAKPFGEIVLMPRAELERHEFGSVVEPFIPEDGDWLRAAREVQTAWQVSDE